MQHISTLTTGLAWLCSSCKILQLTQAKIRINVLLKKLVIISIFVLSILKNEKTNNHPLHLSASRLNHSNGGGR